MSEIDIAADVSQLPYEQARDQLVSVVRQLESGQLALQQSMELWEYGEKLASHCDSYLKAASQKIETITGGTDQD